MKYLVSEGKHDACFLESFVKKEFAFKSLTFNDQMKKAVEPFSSPYYSDSYDCIIYGDNGRPNVYRRVLPRIISDGFGRIKKIFYFYLVIDQDYNDKSNHVQKINVLTCIKNNLRKKKFKEILPIDIEDGCLKVVSKRNSLYRMDIKVFIIPTSLERQIHLKFLQKFPDKAKRWGIPNSNSVDPHIILKILVEKFETDSKYEFIQWIVVEEWFIDEEWYGKLKGLLEPLH